MEWNKYFLNWFLQRKKLSGIFLASNLYQGSCSHSFSILCPFIEYWMNNLRALYFLHREHIKQTVTGMISKYS